MKPLILINFKKVSGNNALVLTNLLNESYPLLRQNYEIAIAVQPTDGGEICRMTDIPVFIHDIYSALPLYEVVDADYVKENSISGLLLNHPENKLSKSTLYKNYRCSKKFHLKSIIGATSLDEAMDINKEYCPDYIAIEDEELIGKDISIRDKCSFVVQDATSSISNKVLFGAGIRSSRDIRYVMDNGGWGVLLASAVVKAAAPSRALMELLQ